ncbi:division/cell wall cluster transcriptional repressor MraZ [Candidatus Cerribacteria bacterium 'Amazon FNV 2010 28 9']|uniref:Transcriptional regulator MraZ n=1 Tax=Candidatus Cerribacteria bacterium 'Amazon FNV 2010 28 9' TaxID=2081795 RepID=A0A317JPY2_9BACT|nr:MAG: division/cell wall cluster transcriptional repressor MraZ [Candidatus Cerribacteria bacterium 'Amazon FNV 2010 28 9']
MYIGTYYHTLETKNRVSLPVSFRTQFTSGILTKGLDGCLFLFDKSEWEKKLTQFASLEFTKKAHRDFVRLMTNEAVEVEVDRQGRILIPEHLKDGAHLQKELVITGSMDRIEIWERVAYHAYIEVTESNAEAISESISLVNSQ